MIVLKSATLIISFHMIYDSILGNHPCLPSSEGLAINPATRCLWGHLSTWPEMSLRKWGRWEQLNFASIVCCSSIEIAGTRNRRLQWYGHFEDLLN